MDRLDAKPSGYLETILRRKEREVQRRQRHRRSRVAVGLEPTAERAAKPELVMPSTPMLPETLPFCEHGRRAPLQALRRGPHQPVKIIAEIKFASPSKGLLRQRQPGAVQRLAQELEAGGAAALSVLADGPAFLGSPLDIRRARSSVALPVLFKEFVLDPVQLELAQAMGATMVLLIVRALDADRLRGLAERCLEMGLEPVVEAANEAELAVALSTAARIVGFNIRNLDTFDEHFEAGFRALERVPPDRIRVWMSGVRCLQDLRRVAAASVDAVLVGEGLIAVPAPGERLRYWLEHLADAHGRT